MMPQWICTKPVGQANQLVRWHHRLLMREVSGNAPTYRSSSRRLGASAPMASIALLSCTWTASVL